MIDYIVHTFVIVMVAVDLYQHWTHHRRNKKRRVQLYTIDEAKAVLFDQAVTDGIITYKEYVPSHANRSLIGKPI